MKGCWTKLRNGTIDKFKLRFRSRKKAKSESFYLRSRWIQQKENTIVLEMPGQKPLELWTGKRAWHGDIVMDCRLQRTWTNEYYLCIPQSFKLPSASYENLSGNVPVLLVENQDQQKTNKNRMHITIMERKKKLIRKQKQNRLCLYEYVLWNLV